MLPRRPSARELQAQIALREKQQKEKKEREEAIARDHLLDEKLSQMRKQGNTNTPSLVEFFEREKKPLRVESGFSATPNPTKLVPVSDPIQYAMVMPAPVKRQAHIRVAPSASTIPQSFREARITTPILASETPEPGRVQKLIDFFSRKNSQPLVAPIKPPISRTQVKQRINDLKIAAKAAETAAKEASEKRAIELKAETDKVIPKGNTAALIQQFDRPVIEEGFVPLAPRAAKAVLSADDSLQQDVLVKTPNVQKAATSTEMDHQLALALQLEVANKLDLANLNSKQAKKDAKAAQEEAIARYKQRQMEKEAEERASQEYIAAMMVVSVAVVVCVAHYQVYQTAHAAQTALFVATMQIQATVVAAAVVVAHTATAQQHTQLSHHREMSMFDCRSSDQAMPAAPRRALTC